MYIFTEYQRNTADSSAILSEKIIGICIKEALKNRSKKAILNIFCKTESFRPVFDPFHSSKK